MKEKRPLKYLYIISACMVIVLCGWLCYKYIKVNQSLKESDNDKSNISLVEDKSGANRPVLAEGMIPIIYNEKKCGDLDDPTEEKYPGCYEYTIDNITETDLEGMLNDMCVGKWKYPLGSCTISINNIKEGKVDNLDYWARSYISYGFTMKSKKTFLKDNVINSTLIKADNTNNNWYDYENKMWANAVMVKTEKRDKYMNAKVGTEIKEDDVLAYYVWIPRYKYQLFNAEYKEPVLGEDDINCVDNCPEEQLIEVIFESGTNTTGETRCQVSEIGVETCTNKENGKWYTHPAFTFGDTELKGLWVGKFETSGNATTPTIKPNMTSLTNQNVSTQFITSQKFNSTNYLTKNGTKQTDAHMMKNIEWGAVAYLKQSKYGLGNTDMGQNNYYYCDKYGDDYTSYDKSSVYCESQVYYKTGCGDNANIGEDSVCNAYYTVRGRMASTTGNITGVYDMSGGTDEYVMGVIQDNDTTKRSPMSGKKEKIGNGIEESYSGYVGKIGIILEWDKIDYVDSGNTLAFPNLKYYDLYANDTSDSYYAGSHLGDATGETAGWYNDYSHFISFRGPWFFRGLDTFNYIGSTGIFAFGDNGGGASDYFTFRSVLSITK